MKKILHLLFLLLIGPIAVASGFKFSAKEMAADYRNACEYKSQADLPTVEQLMNPSNNHWDADFRSCDLSDMDLSMYPSNLADYVYFDSKTKWPSKKKMPAGFNPKKYLKDGRNPGLHVRDLHKRGITGKGVAIAIIDQPLLTTHQEYKKQLKLYQNNCNTCLASVSGLCSSIEKNQSSMHGPAVSSIAVGKTVGVAPKADLYYFSAPFIEGEEGRFDARPITQTLHQIMQVNNHLPEGKRILIVSISRGFSSRDIGAAEFKETVEDMTQNGFAIFTTNDVRTISRAHADDNANDNSVYTRGAYWWSEEELPYYAQLDMISVPTDFRVTAAPNGNKDYVAYQNGGLSWAVPYAAGLYALGKQVYPELTEALFWKVARETSANTQVQGPSGKMYLARYFVQPVKLIEKLENLNKEHN